MPDFPTRRIRKDTAPRDIAENDQKHAEKADDDTKNRRRRPSKAEAEVCWVSEALLIPGRGSAGLGIRMQEAPRQLPRALRGAAESWRGSTVSGDA